MRLIQYRYLISVIIGGCLISYGAFLFIKGDKASARAFIIWGSLSIAFSLVLKKLLAGKK
ncbi:hypothetical protein [Flavihumibacter fluvii]|uniref:hypothetical protein n=1 Tax=Flavihumibacter fluvii TaxID=2838157 RepID=UPI001BDF5AFF|nr:hypothetical protein [Flavihumibacter fluvii]ULQ51234.1 hypothetical protein KJS93_14180 [Flavihumibacter fluvii]